MTTALQASCLSDNLKPALAAVTRAISKRRNGLPVLSGVLVAFNEGGLELTATDLTTVLRAPVACRVDRGGGAVVIPADALTAFTKRVPKGERIEIEAVPGETNGRDFTTWTVTLRAGTSSTTLKAIDAEEFPSAYLVPSDAPDTEVVLVAGGALVAAIKSVAFAAADDKYARPILSSVLISIRGTALEAVACDGYRVAVSAPVGTACQTSGTAELVVRIESIKAWLGAVGRLGDDPVTIRAWGAKNAIEIESDGLLLRASLVDGRYPNYQQVIPAHCKASLRIPRASEVADALKGVKATVAKLHLGPDGMTITAHDHETDSDSSASIEGLYLGEPLTISVSPSILAGIANAPHPGVEIRANDPLSPLVAVIPSGPGWRYAFMPVRTS